MMDVEHRCQKIDGLLPWYVNRSLTAQEAEIVQVHLDECEQCRSEAEWLAQVGSHLRDSPKKLATGAAGEAEAPLLALQKRIAAGEDRKPVTGRTWQQPAFALAAGLLLALAATLGVVMTWQPLTPRYHTVTDPVPPAANVVTMTLELKANAPLSSLYGILEQHDAVVVAGPDNQGRVALEFRLADGESVSGLVSSLESHPQVARVTEKRE